MVLRLPDYDQVIFSDSPLEEVVCQIRFHPILRIGIAAPADFQDLIREHYPVFGQEQGLQVGVAGEQPFVAANQPAWQFKTQDEKWVVSLTTNFLALKTTDYHDFEGFSSRFTPIVKALEDLYSPPIYTRVGLRYVNRIMIPRSGEHKDRVRWELFLNDLLSGPYADPVLDDGIAAAEHHFVLRTEKGQIGWRYSRDIGDVEGKSAERFTLDSITSLWAQFLQKTLAAFWSISTMPFIDCFDGV